ESPSPSLTSQQSQHLFEQVGLDYDEEPTAWKRLKLVRENEHFNALQVKFAYAITGHKAQGGQWHTVFVERPFMPEGPDREYLRWLYTAITRATHKVFLIGFDDENFKR
ncbi:MAG TPA: ATP-binding domain-containing protein, partial [Flavobacterium sp.]|nr:ATP-binding domain-containing protein [Flavobacterium sp.]